MNLSSSLITALVISTATLHAATEVSIVGEDFHINGKPPRPHRPRHGRPSH